MKLSDYVIDFLVSKNVRCVFEVCGGAITHLLDSMHGRKDIKAVSMHHEQAASFAADGYARVGGVIGVAMATSGPGATNLITGIASSFFDSIPALFITGQVNTYEFKFDTQVRQIGFQETDIVNIVKPIVKKAIFVGDPQDIRYVIEEAYYIAKSGRPGPVLIDIPMDVQRAEIDPGKLKSFDEKFSSRISCEPDKKTLAHIIEAIKLSKRPVVLIGGGVRLSNAEKELLRFISKTSMPVCTSLMGLDAFPQENKSFIGMIGIYGNRYANLAAANADLVLAIGIRFDTRQTGTLPETFAREADIIHVDIDKTELNNKVKVKFPIHCDARRFLELLNKEIGSYNIEGIMPWIEATENYKQKYPSYLEPMDDKINPNYFMMRLSQFIPEGAIISVDVGQNQMWAAQSLDLKSSHRMLTQGGMGSMGSSLSMAIGASFVGRAPMNVVITGDGGFQLNIQELQTLYEHKLPIKIILLNNLCYGMVRQFQEQYFGSRFQSTVKGYSAPDFQAVVSSYRLKTMKIKHVAQIDSALKDVFNNPDPVFLEVEIDANCKVIPKLSVAAPIEDQDPKLSRDEFKSNMFIDTMEDDKI